MVVDRSCLCKEREGECVGSKESSTNMAKEAKLVKRRLHQVSFYFDKYWFRSRGCREMRSREFVTETQRIHQSSS